MPHLYVYLQNKYPDSEEQGNKQTNVDVVRTTNIHDNITDNLFMTDTNLKDATILGTMMTPIEITIITSNSYVNSPNCKIDIIG